MSLVVQAHRPLRVLIPDRLGIVLLGFSGSEGISRLFEYKLDIAVNRFVPFPSDEVVGQLVTVEVDLPSGGVRHLHGLVRRLDERHRDDEFRYYRAILVPILWSATRNQHCRTFEQLTVPEILEAVLQPLGQPYTLDLAREYQPRNYCVQYNESDFAFISRLMEEEGICYLFVHGKNQHTLKILDDQTRFPKVDEPTSIEFDEMPDSPDDTYRVTHWQTSQQLCTVKQSTIDYHFELPSRRLSRERSIDETVKVGDADRKVRLGKSAEWERFEYPGNYSKLFDSVTPGGGSDPAALQNVFTEDETKVAIRTEREQMRAVRVRGRSNCLNFVAGHTFELGGHWSADGTYLLTKLQQSMSLDLFHAGEEAPDVEYKQRFSGIPAGVQYRPRRKTPKPRIHGTQTAVVDGDGDIHLDKYGRIKVKFIWNQATDQRSCWVRVAMPWAGRRWGMFFWPRPGHEVKVAYENGDPDCPVVVGSVYNARNMPPLTLPENQDICGIKSCSMGGDPLERFNGIIFHDTPDDEHLQIHSETQ